MSLFIRLDTGYWSHRKTIKLRSMIGDAALWVMPRLWCYCATNQPDGVLASYSAEELAIAIGYSGNAPSMLQALLDAGFLDPDPIRLHSWKDHNGYHQIYADRARKAAQARWGPQREETPPTPPREEKTRQERRGEERRIAPSNASSNASSIVKRNKDLPKLPEALSNLQGLNEEWLNFVQHRLELKKPVTPTSATAIFRKLQSNPKQAVDMLRQSIANGWQGIFELKQEGNGSTGTAHTAKPQSRPDPHARARPWVYKPARDLLQEQLDKMDAEGKCP